VVELFNFLLSCKTSTHVILMESTQVSEVLAAFDFRNITASGKTAKGCRSAHGIEVNDDKSIRLYRTSADRTNSVVRVISQANNVENLEIGTPDQ
jgi:hypothetical protein